MISPGRSLRGMALAGKLVFLQMLPMIRIGYLMPGFLGFHTQGS